MSKVHLTLSEDERAELKEVGSKRQISARLAKRIVAILALDGGSSLQVTAALVQVTPNTVATWRDRYQAEGIAGLYERPRTGRPIVIDGAQRAQLTALACSEAPEGYDRWSLRLLADKAVELGICEISHTHIATLLKKTSSDLT